MKSLNYKVIGSILLVAQFATVQTSMADSTDATGGTAVNAVDSSFQAAISNRPAMTIEIIDRLREGAEAKGLAGWESELAGKLNNASDEAFLAAYNAGSSYKAVAAAASGVSFDKASLVNNLNAGGTPEALLGSADKDFVYTPFPPCRVVDTRTAGGKIAAVSSRGFVAHGTGAQLAGQGGTAGGCLVNGNSDAFGGYVFNVTVVAPEANGHIRIYAQGDPLPPASIANYVTGQTIANSTVVKSGYIVGNDFRVYSSARAHVIVDVMGYFEKPERTLPDTYITRNQQTIAAGTILNFNSPNCPAAYRLIAGGYDTSSFNIDVADNFADTPLSGANVAIAKWKCSIRNNGGSTINATCLGYCLRIPGK